VIIGGGYNSRGSRLNPGGRFSSLGNKTSIYITIAAAIFVHLIPSGNRGIRISLFERKGQLMLLFGSYSRKSKKSGALYRYSRTPGRTSLYVSYWSRRRATSGWKYTNQHHVMDPWGSRRGSRGDPFVRRFYISLGRHLLDKSFVLNSNNILIYWYSFTSNELYSQI
jgi:hypothetical protein